MAFPDLGLWYIVATRLHPVLDALNGEILGNEQHVQDDGITRSMRSADQLKLGRV